MAIKFKTAEQIDKLADHEIAKILSENWPKLMSKYEEKLKEVYNFKRRLEYRKHEFESHLKFLKDVGRTQEIKKAENAIASADETILKYEEEEMNVFKAIEALLKFALAGIERLRRITKKEEKFTAKELSALKTLLKASIPFKKVLKM